MARDNKCFVIRKCCPLDLRKDCSAARVSLLCERFQLRRLCRGKCDSFHDAMPRFPFRAHSGETGNERKRNWKRSALFVSASVNLETARKRDFRKVETRRRFSLPLVSSPVSAKMRCVHRSLIVYFRPEIVSQPSRSALFAILEIVPLLTPISSASSPQVFKPSSIHCRKIAIESASR